MEYTDMEKQVLSLMERTDFKHISKSDVISYASKLNELRPEVATQVLAQYPELAKLIQSSMVEYREPAKAESSTLNLQTKFVLI